MAQLIRETIYQNKKTGKLYLEQDNGESIDLYNPVERNLEKAKLIGENNIFRIYEFLNYIN